ncbi:MAG TPA: alpha/beta fold hydrolase [Deinococcales bacterium]|nr:alpha/beta fold hydrolase [Deinococcales bacterium]
MTTLNEQHTTFAVGGQLVHGMYHFPPGPGPHPAVLMLHGFTGSRGETHRLFVLLSRLLAENGIASLRFDFRGSGESEGGFEEMTASREVEDAVQALAQLRARPEVDPERVGLLGLSMGGMIAALTVGEPGVRVKSLVLWAPAAPESWTEQTPPGWSPEMMPEPWDAGGNPVGRAFWRDLSRLDSYAAVKAHQGPALLVHAREDPTVKLETGLKYARAVPMRQHLVDGALHTFQTLEAQAEVHRRTLDFLRETL